MHFWYQTKVNIFCSKYSEKHEQQNDGDRYTKKPGNDGHDFLLKR